MGFMVSIVIAESVLILSLLWDKKHLIAEMSKLRKNIRILKTVLHNERGYKEKEKTVLIDSPSVVTDGN